MILDKTNIMPPGARDTIDELRHELEAHPILGIKKRLIFITDLLREVGLPPKKGYYILAHPVSRDFTPSRLTKADPQERVAGSGEKALASTTEGNHWIRLLTKKRDYVIGRNPQVTDITFDDVYVSRKHCRLTYNRKAWEIIDLGSSNGVRVNFALTRAKSLSTGDLIGLSSNTTLIFFNTFLFNSDSNNFHERNVGGSVPAGETAFATTI